MGGLLHLVQRGGAYVTMALSCLFARCSELLVENREIFIPYLYLAPLQTRRSALSVARTTSATGALQQPDHVCGTRYHST